MRAVDHILRRRKDKMLEFVTEYGTPLIFFLICLLFSCSAYKNILRYPSTKKNWKTSLAVIIGIFSVVAFAIGWFIGSVI